MRNRIEGLSHTPKSNSAYYEARELMRHIIRRYIKETKTTSQDYYQHYEGNNFRLDEETLNDYQYKGSEKSKASLIKQFKEDTLLDIDQTINKWKEQKD